MTQPLRILMPTDGSPSAERALRHVIDLAGRGLAIELHLLNVQPPVRGVAASMISAADLTDYHRDEGNKALAGPLAIATEAGLAARTHISVGEPGPVALVFAQRLGAQQIVMGTRGFGGVAGLLMGSVARHIVGESDLPVTLVR